MKIYWVMLEVAPSDENEECEGAFLNCWVKAESEQKAIEAAKEYAKDQDWEYIGLEDISVVTREQYTEDEEDADSLEAYDEACREGISGIFYTWDDEDE